MLNSLEIRAAKTAFIASVCMLTTTFIAGGIYWQHNGRLAENKPSSDSEKGLELFRAKLRALPWPGRGWRRGWPQFAIQISAAPCSGDRERN